MYGGLLRPEEVLILANTPSHALSKSFRESVRLTLGSAGWNTVASSLKQAANDGQSRLSKAVRKEASACSTEFRGVALVLF
jgi:hypothetical protein